MGSCDGRAPRSGDSDATASPEAPEPTQPEPEREPDTPERGAPVPDGYRIVRAEESGIELATPETWTLIKAEEIANGDNPVLDEYADSLGLTPEQMRMAFQQIDLMAMAVNGDNINVVPARGLAEIPTDASFRAQLEVIGAKITEIHDAETPAGPGRVVHYLQDVLDGTKYGAMTFVQTSSGVVSVTVTVNAAGDATDIMRAILPTIAETGAPGQA